MPDMEWKEGDLMVWHIPQIPGKAFEIKVDDIRQGKWLMDILAHYDIFQWENNIKPDYSNANGLCRLEKGEPIDDQEAEKNHKRGVPEGLVFYDIDSSELAEEWAALEMEEEEANA